MDNVIDLTEVDLPAKRQKISRTGNGEPVAHNTGESTPVRCKSEETVVELSSPPQLVDEGVHRVLLPISCCKGTPGYEQERKKLAKYEVGKLRQMGLRERRILIRCVPSSTAGAPILTISLKVGWYDYRLVSRPLQLSYFRPTSYSDQAQPQTRLE